MKVLLCTGGIGSGKSFVVRLFNAASVPSYDCDKSARCLYDTDSVLFERVVDIAGSDVVRDGRIFRKALSEKFFSNPEIKSAVESAVHPAVVADFERWKSSQRGSLVMIESAIMLEKPLFRGIYDYSLTVCAPLEVRVSRVMKRDSCSRDEVMRRMANQWSDDSRRMVSDFVMENDGQRPLVPQVADILKRIDYGFC